MDVGQPRITITIVYTALYNFLYSLFPSLFVSYNDTFYFFLSPEILGEFSANAWSSAMTSRARYIPELVYALAFSSISVHLLWQRRTAETDRRHYSARISILGELAARLRAGEAVPDVEISRLRRLAETAGAAEETHPGENIGWRDVVFGRKESGMEREGKEVLERRELERGASRRWHVARTASAYIPLIAAYSSK